MKIANAYEVSGRDIILALRVDPVRVRLAKSTRFPGRLPVFQHFYPSTRFFNISTCFWNSDFQTKLYFY